MVCLVWNLTMKSSNGNIFHVTGPLCGKFTDPLCLNKRLSKQSWGWWFETPSRSLWRHRNVCGRLQLTWQQGHIKSPNMPTNDNMQFWLKSVFHGVEPTSINITRSFALGLPQIQYVANMSITQIWGHEYEQYLLIQTQLHGLCFFCNKTAWVLLWK